MCVCVCVCVCVYTHTHTHTHAPYLAGVTRGEAAGCDEAVIHDGAEEHADDGARSEPKSEGNLRFRITLGNLRFRIILGYSTGVFVCVCARARACVCVCVCSIR